MNLPLLFARRYLRSKKSLSVINTTATVSSVAIGVAVAAMVVLMSVFNGFDGLLRSMNKTTEADLVVTPTKGDRVDITLPVWEGVRATEGVEATAFYLEQSVMAEYNGHQMVGTLCGVDDHYTRVVNFTEGGMMWYGDWRLVQGERRKAVVGFAMDALFADGYSVRNAALHGKIALHALRRDNISPLLPIGAINTVEVLHAGTLTDAAPDQTNYIFVSLDVAQKLLTAPDRASALAIRIAEGADMERVQEEVQQVVGEKFRVSNRYERDEALFRVMKVEKASIFFILLLVTLIAAVSIVGSLVMLIIEKRNDTATLYAMGARRDFVRRVFTLEGLLIGLRGAFGGVIGGLAVCVAQMELGLVKMPGNTFLVENYPVDVRASDMVWIIVAVVAVNYLITNFTVRRMIPKNEKPNETRI